MSVHYKKDGRWFVVWRDDNNKRREKWFGRGAAAKREAKAFDYQIKSDKKSGKQLSTPGKVRFDELAQDYLDRCRAEGKSYQYRNDIRNLLQNHVLPMLIHRPVDELTYQDFVKIADYFQSRNCSQSTINRYMGYLRAIVRYGIRTDKIRNNPLKGWQKPKEPQYRVRLTVSDLRKILNHAQPHLAWAIEVTWNLGTRPGPSELFALKWTDVDWQNQKVWIWASKTMSWRDVPISDTFLHRLRAKYSESRSGYLIEYNGNPIKKLRRSFQTACRKAEIGYRVRMYDVRHLFASIMLAGGADLAAVSRLLGHASTHMTADTYYQYLQGEKERAKDLLPELLGEESGNSKVVPISKK